MLLPFVLPFTCSPNKNDMKVHMSFRAHVRIFAVMATLRLPLSSQTSNILSLI